MPWVIMISLVLILLDSLVIRVEVFGHVGHPTEAAALPRLLPHELRKRGNKLQTMRLAAVVARRRDLNEKPGPRKRKKSAENHKCFHPELADTLLGIADNLRFRGMYGPWDGPALSESTAAHIEENKDKEEEFLRQQAILAAEAKKIVVV